MRRATTKAPSSARAERVVDAREIANAARSDRPALGKLDGLGSVGGLSNHLKAGLRLDQRPEARTHQSVIVGDRVRGIA